MKSVNEKKRVFGNLVYKKENFDKLMQLHENFLSRQEDLIQHQENLLDKHESVLNKSISTDKHLGSTTELIDMLNKSKAIMDLSVKDYGRVIGSFADKYVEEFLTNNTNLNFVDSDKFDDNRDGNAAGYDCLSDGGKRVQVKFRQYDGKTPYSVGTYFATTRRMSEKNKGEAGSTGQVAYRSSEFDGAFFILAPKDKNFRDRKYWSYSYVPANKLINSKFPDLITTRISSRILEEGKNWKEMLNAGV